MVSQINSTKQLANNTTLNPSQNHSVTIRAGLSQAFHNKDLKPGHTQAAFGNSFQSVEINLKQLVEHITGGGAFTMGHFSSSNRKGENFVSAQLLALDLDENIGVEQALSCDLIRRHALLAHPSASSTPEHRKTRVLFRLDEPITDRHAWERLQRGLIHHFAHLKPDDACKDAARMFYGSTNTSDQVYINYAACLPLEQAEAMAAQREAEEEAYLRAISEREGPKVKVSGTRAEKYAAATLDNLLTELRSTTSSRHDTLIRVGTSLFAMAASSEWPGIDDATVERELQAACAANGYTAKRGQGEIQRCINDARRYGHSAPRPLELPEKPAQHQAAGETPVDPHQAFKKRWKRCETQLAGLMPRADETIHQPYVGTIPDGDVLLDSPLSTGKTTAGKKLAESTSSILAVNDRRTLTRALAKHMRLDHYEHFEGPQAGAIRSSNKLAITVDSLHRLKDARPPEVLHLEEIDFILRQFSAATMKDENRDANMAALVDQIGNAGRVVAVQANISPVACKFIKHFRPGIRLVSNTYRPDRGDVTFVTDHPGVSSTPPSTSPAREGWLRSSLTAVPSCRR